MFVYANLKCDTFGHGIDHDIDLPNNRTGSAVRA